MWFAAWWQAQAQSAHEAWLEHVGVSMVPTLRAGDRLRIVPLSGKERPRRGELVLARRGEVLVTHRVIEVLDSGEVVTRGDAVPVNDPPLGGDQVLAKVVECRRNGRSVSLSSPTAVERFGYRIREMHERLRARRR